MMRFTKCVLVGLVVIIQAGCRQQPGQSGPARPQARTIRQVCLVTPTTAEDEGLGRQTRLALDKLAAEQGFQARHQQVAAEDAKAAVRRAARDGADLVILFGEDYLHEGSAVGEGLPETRLVCLGTAETAPNIESVRIRLDQAAYLCGVLAALTSQTHRGAAIGDERTALQMDSLNAFCNGGLAADSRFHATASFAPAASAAIIREATGMAINDGADMVFQATSVPAAVFGAAAAMPNIYAFGFGSDHSQAGPSVVLASAVVDLEAVLKQALARASQGTGLNPVEHSLGDGTVQAVINPALRRLLPQEALAKMAEAKEAIKSGRLDVQVWPGPTSRPVPETP